MSITITTGSIVNMNGRIQVVPELAYVSNVDITQFSLDIMTLFTVGFKTEAAYASGSEQVAILYKPPGI